MPLPPNLLQAIAAPEGGRVVLVLGAGCSFEPPTSIPLAKPCSQTAYRKLVDDGELAPGECECADDLSALADFVKAKFGAQKKLVDRLPVGQFRTATPNDGHLIAAALLLDGAVTHVLTLNFDLALTTALSTLGAKDAVSVIKGPEDHGSLGRANVIYLHRNVEVDGELWVLTSDALENAWRDAWEELIAAMVTTAPITVFAGMGSSCGVLRQSVERLRTALGNETKVFLANPGDPEWSQFAQETGLTEADYIQVGWVDFMRGLSTRVASERCAQIESTCLALVARESWPAEDVPSLCQRLIQLGLVGLGKLRAAWLLEDRPYCCHENATVDLLADLLLAIGFIERTAHVTIRLRSDRLIEAINVQNQLSSFLIFSGRGSLRWASAEPAIKHSEKYFNHDSGARRPRRALVSGVIGTTLDRVTPPASIVDVENEESILSDQEAFKMWSIEELRATPDAVLQELLA